MKITFNNGKELYLHKVKSIKRFVSLGVILTTLTATTVFADTTNAVASLSSTISSKGSVTYDNPNGTDITIDSSDIQENRDAIKTLGSNISTLESQTAGLGGDLIYKDGSYYIDADGDTSTTDDQTPIGAVGDATAGMVLKGHTFSSASAGTNVSGTMEIPTLLTLGTVTGADNDGISDDVTISNAYNQTTDNSEINLGIGDSITIPAGYYDKPLTINNSVINRGTLNAVLTSSSNSINLSSGYYDDSSITTNISNLKGTINYTLVHQHTDSCYSYTYGERHQSIVGTNWGSWEDDTHYPNNNPGTHNVYQCKDCGLINLYGPCIHRCSAAPMETYITGKTLTCGITENSVVRETDDYSSIAANEKISKVTITY